MSKPKPKKINAYWIYADTGMDVFKSGEACGIAFDIGKKEMQGFLIEDSHVALAVSGYFKQMAKALTKAGK